jgi:hypothetical protein
MSQHRGKLRRRSIVSGSLLSFIDDAAAEEADSRLKAGIKTEYDAMLAGGSHVVPLLADAERLGKKGLQT